MSKPADATDSRLAHHHRNQLHRCEKRREMLERLSEIGMDIAEQLGEWARDGFTIREVDFVNPFPKVSRAIRLTLALQARIDQQIQRLLETGPAGADSTPAPPPPVATSKTAPARERAPEGERLREHESDDAILDLPFDEAVKVIRADLGLGADDEDLPPPNPGEDRAAGPGRFR